MAKCPRGHSSDDPEFCSVCGSALAAPAPAPAASPAHAPAASAPTCPRCHEPRTDPHARFCEGCRHDFLSAPPLPPAAPAPPAPTPPAPTPAPAAAPPAAAAPHAPVPAPAQASAIWRLVQSVDPTLDTEPDPACVCPKNEPDREILVTTAEMLIGRRDDRRDIVPDIALNDPGVSRRHAKILRFADGTLGLQDLASTNGTRLNGTPVPSGERRTLRAGDEVTLGRWTRLRVSE